MDHLARDAYGGVLGLVGYGRIGREVARRAEGFGMEVLHCTRTPTGFPGYTASWTSCWRRRTWSACTSPSATPPAT